MKGRAIAVAAAVAVVIGAGIWLRYRILSSQDRTAYQEQLRLAWAEGLPTNAAQFAPTIEPAPPAENAAPAYRALHTPLKSLGYVPLLNMLSDPSAANLANAKAILARAKPILSTLDAAVRKPRCWFDRDWSPGAAVLFPEYVDMKSAATLVTLRGAVAATDGDVAAALGNFREDLRVASHVGEEGTDIGAMVEFAIYVMGLSSLADWCLANPSVAVYRASFRRAVRAMPRPNLRRECRGDLFGLLSVIDDSLTAEGRKSLGLPAGGQSVGARILALLLSQPKARIEIVRASREVWSALDAPAKQMDARVSAALDRRNAALWAFPAAAELYSQLGDGASAAVLRMKSWRGADVRYTALSRAFSGPRTSKSIKTSDLLSPYDGKPITYAYDGRQITISMNSDDPSQPVVLKFPPDRAKP